MLEPRRIAVFISSCVCLLSAGSLFSFSSIGESLKARLGFSSSDLNVVSGIGNAALYVTFLLVGPMFDYCGPRITMLAAVFFFSLGYLLIWLAYEGRLASPFSTYGAVAFYYFLCGTGSSAAYMATIGVNVTNFPSNTVGKVVGVLLLFYGLSGTVYSQVYSNLYASNTGGYLLFLTTSTLVINFVIPQPSPDCKTINVAEVKKTLIASETRIEKMDSISTIPS
ncbi:major facilitator superfamily domain-containing protein [Chytridium lagenaria]|nr:major facilitator superfamily domain-containing protein [Chytridium lagenaria]